jgi:hypothetical protein
MPHGRTGKAAMGWWEQMRRADPHLQVLVAILALPLALVLLGALALAMQALLRLAGAI